MGRSASVIDFDVAIVGAGISGAYCAYRLSQARPDIRLAVFERSARVGGRLMSIDVGTSIKAELGGGFVSSLHRNVVGLSAKMKLGLSPIRWERRSLHLRGWRGTDTSISEAASVLNLAQHERGKAPYALVTEALTKVAPGWDMHWPMANTDPSAGRPTLEAITFDGRPLREWPFRDLLRKVLSDSAYDLITNTMGSTANVGPHSALEMVRTLQFELAPQRAFIVNEGYDEIVHRLLSVSGAALHLEHDLLAISRDTHALSLRFANRQLRASHLILAVPRAAIARIAGAETLARDLASVADIAAFKLFMTFGRAWWDEVKTAKAGRGIAASYTDLPMQQCYFADNAEGEAALCLAAFADASNAEWWERETSPGAEALRQLRVLYPGFAIPAPQKIFSQAWSAGCLRAALARRNPNTARRWISGQDAACRLS